MKNTTKIFTYVLLGAIASIMLICFVFALFFGVAVISAVTRVSFSQFIVLASFCYLFSLAGSGFLTITNLLYGKARRCN